MLQRVYGPNKFGFVSIHGSIHSKKIQTNDPIELHQRIYLCRLKIEKTWHQKATLWYEQKRIAEVKPVRIYFKMHLKLGQLL